MEVFHEQILSKKGQKVKSQNEGGPKVQHSSIDHQTTYRRIPHDMGEKLSAVQPMNQLLTRVDIGLGDFSKSGFNVS